MRLKMNLTTKAIFFVAVPCAIQIVLLLWYSAQYQRLESVLANESNGKTVTGYLNWIGYVLASSLLISPGPQPAQQSPKMEEYKHAAQKSVGELADLLRGNSEQASAVAELNGVCQKLFDTASQDTAGRLALVTEKFSNLRHQIIALQKSKFRVQTTDLPELRQQQGYLIGALAAISVGTGIFLIVLFQGNVVKRLNVIEDNSSKFSKGEKLNQPVEGNDEIAYLDRSFHLMADLVEDAAIKERAIIKNATAVICSLSPQGEFLQVNPACRKVFGMKEEQLKSMVLRDIVADEYKATIGGILADACSAHSAVEFENQIVKPDGAVVDILWSAQWSESEQALFCVAQDISEKKRIEELKKEIVQMVSHDLRSPLMAITAAIFLIRNGKGGEVPPAMEKHLTTAQVSVDRMKTLVDDLLDIEKIKSGKLEINQVDVDLAEVFEEVVLSLSPWAKSVGVSLESTGEPPVAFVDHDRIVQVLVNLVANALKFSPQGGTIRLESLENEEEISVFVLDEGPGIPADLLPVLFERFTQAKASGANAKGGSGLGLAICKSLVELHGGKIWAEAPKNGGTRIVFTLPKAKNSVFS
jgi:PAS domain S-box-containing protein